MKRRLFLSATIVSISLLSGAEVGGIEGKDIEYVTVIKLDRIKGKNLRLLQLALPEFVKTGLELEKYNIIVATVKGRPAVIFEQEVLTPLGAGGSFEVLLSEDGSRVERAYFGR